MFASNLRRKSCCLIGCISSYFTIKSTVHTPPSCDFDNQKFVEKKQKQDYDIVIIGGGVVGLSVARSCAVQTNASILLIDKEDVVAAGVSARNSGLGCTGYDAPIGSLERRLLRRSIRRHQNLYRSLGLSHNHVRKCGSLVVAWNETELEKLPDILQENRDAGDMEALLLNQEELRSFEPNLSHKALGAVFCPYESVVEPWLVPMGYAESARRNGVDFQLGSEVSKIEWNPSSNLWNLYTVSSDRATIARSLSGEILIPPPHAAASSSSSSSSPHHSINKQSDSNFKEVIATPVIINCAGLYGDEIESMIRKNLNSQNTIRSQGSFSSPSPSHSPSSSSSSSSQPNTSGFTITPRKGQFLVYKIQPSSQNDSNSTPSHPPYQLMTIEPVATQFTKGVIVWQTLYGNVIVGPTADDIFDKEDYQTDAEMLKKLQNYGESIYPFLKNAQIVGSYSGLRPATEFRDYQIYSNINEGRKWITVGGIRSTGLTASSGIGEYVTELYCQLSDPSSTQNKSFINDLSEEDIAADGLLGVSISAASPLPLDHNRSTITPLSPSASASSSSTSSRSIVSCPPVPSLDILAQEFQNNLKTSNKNPAEGSITLYGRQCRVTHPISSFGLEFYDTSHLQGVKEGTKEGTKEGK